MIRSFCSTNALGNLHKIHWHKNPNAEAINSAPPSSHSNAIDVHITQVDKTHYDLQCFKNTKAITFCGSGTLAAAHAVKQSGLQAPIVFTQHARTLHIYQQNGLLGFKTRAAKLHPGSHQTLWEKIIGQPIKAINCVGKKNGYAIVELRHPHSVEEAKIQLRALKRFSQRALIITAKARPIQGRQHIVMRYFAPQYGNPEDAATGSANALLMAYWAKKLRVNKIISTQLSQEGGKFYGSYSPPYVRLFGETKAY